MTNMKRTSLLCSMALFLAIGIVGLTHSQEGSAQERAGGGLDVPEWDQAAVTKRAIELELTLREASQRGIKASPQQTALQQRDRNAAQSVIKRAHERSEDYAKKMRAGWNRDESETYFRGVVEAVESIWATAGDAVPDENATALIARLRRLLDELEVSYAAGQ